MHTSTIIALIFFALAAVFAGLAMRNYLKGGADPGSARKTWLLIASIFTLVSILLITM